MYRCRLSVRASSIPDHTVRTIANVWSNTSLMLNVLGAEARLYHTPQGGHDVEPRVA